MLGVHRHQTQEEIYFVIAGKLQFKLDVLVLNTPADLERLVRRYV